MEINDYMHLLTDGSLQKAYFQVLMDEQWHCRDCASQQIGSTQIAGGGGVQGLQRGTKSRPGIITEKRTPTVMYVEKQRHGTDGQVNLLIQIVLLDCPRICRNKF